MLFRALDQNGLQLARWADVELAGAQGTITGVKLANGHIQGSDKSNRIQFGKSLEDRSKDKVWFFTACMFLLLSFGLFCYLLYQYCATLDIATNEEQMDIRKS